MKHKDNGSVAIDYHFFIEDDDAGTIYEGRPLEIMGSHAGVGIHSGPILDPDWANIGITLRGDYHDNLSFDEVPEAQLRSLEALVVALRKQYPNQRLMLHREIIRTGKAKDCPGRYVIPHVKKLRRNVGPFLAHNLLPRRRWRPEDTKMIFHLLAS